MQQQHGARGLRIEGRRYVLDREAYDFLYLCVFDGRFGGQRVITAAVAERLFECSFHSREFYFPYNTNIAQLWIFYAAFTIFTENRMRLRQKNANEFFFLPFGFHYLCPHEKRNRTLFGLGPQAGRLRRRRPYAGGRGACLPGQRLVHACGCPPRRGRNRRRHASPRPARNMARPLPRSGRRAAPRAGRHGREYSAGRLLRLVVRLGRRPSLSGEAFGQGPGADGIRRRDAAGD